MQLLLMILMWHMKQEFSAGGVVFKKSPHGMEILLCQHSLHHGWVFPKGHIGDTIANESKEAAALREVKEETGISGNILSSLKPVEYDFDVEGEKRHKTVSYFLMEYVSGDNKEHDHEMESVAWVRIDEVEDKLTFESDKGAWDEAREKVLSIKY